MSLESTIASLIESNNALRNTFLGWKTEADTALAAALAAMPAFELTYYVDATAGDDTQNGKTPATAFSTLEKAIETAPAVAGVTIYILSDIQLSKYVFSRAQRLYLRGWNKATGAGALRKMTVLGEAINRSTCIAGIESLQGCHISLSHLEVTVPKKSGTVNYITGVFTPYYGGTIFATDCSFKAAAGADASLVQAWGGTVNMYFNESTGDATMPGRYFSGVAAGANPNALNNGYNYKTNLLAA